MEQAIVSFDAMAKRMFKADNVTKILKRLS